MSAHIGVPYSDTTRGGRKNLSGWTGVSQSMSTTGAYDLLADPFSNRSENSSRLGDVIVLVEEAMRSLLLVAGVRSAVN
jgi:hypothetical protein